MTDQASAETPHSAGEATEPASLAGELAAAAWRTLGPDRKAPTAVEPILANKPMKRSVYRLVGAAEDDKAVIAKRCRVGPHQAERLLYQEVLPLLPVRTPRYYGELEAEDGFAWVFLEDVGSQHFSPNDSEHRALAGRWLGALHAAACELPVSACLPDRGPRHYRAHLEAARRLILDNLGNPALLADDITLLRSVLTQCETLEERWDQLEEICAATPSTLIHGDFRPKNAFVLSEPAGQQLLVIDWETAGRGAPAVDLAPSRELYASQVDLEAYCSVVRERWPWFTMTLASRLLWVGLIFRRLAAVEWACSSLASPRPRVLSKPLASIRLYHQELRSALAEAPPGPRL